MDLRARELDHLANVAMNAYWEASGQTEDALALLPLFMALRAAVRMAVATEAGNLAEADSYRVLGEQLLQPSAPRLLAIGGLSGSGKSAVARAVAHELPGCCGARILRTDVIRKRLARLASRDRLAEDAYRIDTRAAVYRLLADRAREALGYGVSVIADTTFKEAPFRAGIERAGRGFAFQGIWLSARPEIRASRIAQRRDDASDATVDIAVQQVEPRSLGAWNIVDGSHLFSAVIETVCRHAEAR